MSSWDIILESEEIAFGNALVNLYRIQSDSTIADRESNHAHSYYELQVITRGSHTYTVGEQAVPVRAGEMILFQPGTVHKAVCPNSGCSICVLSLSVKQLDTGWSVYPHIVHSLDASACRAILLDAPLLSQINTYSRLPESAGVADLLHRKLFACQILVGVLDALGCDGTGDGNPPPEDFDMMLETLVRNSNVSLSGIATRLGYSQRQIARKIKRRYGKTFSQLRKETL